MYQRPESLPGNTNGSFYIIPMDQGNAIIRDILIMYIGFVQKLLNLHSLADMFLAVFNNDAG